MNGDGWRIWLWFNVVVGVGLWLWFEQLKGNCMLLYFGIGFKIIGDGLLMENGGLQGKLNGNFDLEKFDLWCLRSMGRCDEGF